jgi:hypothetical protein
MTRATKGHLCRLVPCSWSRPARAAVPLPGPAAAVADRCGVRAAPGLQVWNSVDQHSRKAHTSIIHGKYSHEETIATASFATDYIIVKDPKEVRRAALCGGCVIL